MPRTLIRSRLLSQKHKPKNKQEVRNTQSNLPPNLQVFKQKLLSGNSFDQCKNSILYIHSHSNNNYYYNCMNKLSIFKLLFE